MHATPLVEASGACNEAAGGGGTGDNAWSNAQGFREDDDKRRERHRECTCKREGESNREKDRERKEIRAGSCSAACTRSAAFDD